MRANKLLEIGKQSPMVIAFDVTTRCYWASPMHHSNSAANKTQNS